MQLIHNKRGRPVLINGEKATKVETLNDGATLYSNDLQARLIKPNGRPFLDYLYHDNYERDNEERRDINRPSLKNRECILAYYNYSKKIQSFEGILSELQKFNEDPRVAIKKRRLDEDSIKHSRKHEIIRFARLNFTPDQIKQLQDLSNINCTNCTNCWFCFNCKDCVNCRLCYECFECKNCDYSQTLAYCKNCDCCEYSRYCRKCYAVNNSVHCYHCNQCTNCHSLSGRYGVYNTQH